jgi:hypothetical protein
LSNLFSSDALWFSMNVWAHFLTISQFFKGGLISDSTVTLVLSEKKNFSQSIFQKQLTMFSFPPKNERLFFLNSALRSLCRIRKGFSLIFWRKLKQFASEILWPLVRWKSKKTVISNIALRIEDGTKISICAFWD